jgi:hypothetical protein
MTVRPTRPARHPRPGPGRRRPPRGGCRRQGRLCDATGIRSIEEFDDRFPMTQSLCNWCQDLEDALWNAGLGDRAILLGTMPSRPDRATRFHAQVDVGASRLPR